MTDIEFYRACRTVEDLIDYLKTLPKETPLSRKNCDGSYNHSTRFYYEDGRLLFGFEGSKSCINIDRERESLLIDFFNNFKKFEHCTYDSKGECEYDEDDKIYSCLEHYLIYYLNSEED